LKTNKKAPIFLIIQ